MKYKNFLPKNQNTINHRPACPPRTIIVSSFYVYMWKTIPMMEFLDRKFRSFKVDPYNGHKKKEENGSHHISITNL